jgi:hypothetical protein
LCHTDTLLEIIGFAADNQSTSRIENYGIFI